LRSSFSGGGKVEASPLSPEIVSTDARFVPRMFKKAPVLDKDLVQWPCFFNVKWTSKKREIPSREQHRKPRTHYSLCFSLQMQHNSIVVRLSPTRVAILGRQKPIWQWVPKWQQLAFWLDLQQSMQTSSPQTLAVGSRRRADT